MIFTISLFWIIFVLIGLLIVFTIYYGFFMEPHPSYTMPKNLPQLKASKVPLSFKVRKEKEFQEFLREPGCVSIFPEISIEIVARTRYANFIDTDTTLHDRKVISTLNQKKILNLPFPTKFACKEVYISKHRGFIAFYSMFDCKLFAIHLNDIVRIRSELPCENRIWIESWIHKTLVQFRIDINKGADLLLRAFMNHDSLSALVETVEQDAVPEDEIPLTDSKIQSTSPELDTRESYYSSFTCHSSARPRKVLAIYNPASGLLKAKEILDDIEFMYKYLGVTLEKYETKYAEHMFTLLKEIFNTSSDERPTYDAILSIGGDGTLFEIINGLKEINESLLETIPIVPIPSGTGNGLASSLYGVSDDYLIPAKAVLHNVRKCMNAIQTTLPEKNKTFVSTLSATLGAIADTDIESEFLRFLGDLRFLLYGFFLIFSFRGYPLKITMSCDENFQPSLETVNTNDKSEITLEGRYFGCAVGNVPYISKDIVGFDLAVPDDDYIDVVLFPKSYNVFNIILEYVALFTGTISSDPNIQYFKTRRISVEPDKSYRPSASVVFDGEPFPITSFTCEVLPKGFYTFSPY